jgi:hypothetical protein
MDPNQPKWPFRVSPLAMMFIVPLAGLALYVFMIFALR